MSLESTGVPSAGQLSAVHPPEHMRKQRAYAVFECFERIPCDPCYWCCPQGAVRAFADINDLPSVDYTKCTGCGICVAHCPGLAVFVVDESHSSSHGLLKLPHEFRPLPVPGELVDLLDREGTRRGKGRVVRVVGKARGDTPVVWVEVESHLLASVRAIRVGGRTP